jgi:hypothetical protein
MSDTFRNACRVFGVSLQPAHPFTPTDKPIIERTLESVKTLFTQYVTGFVGASTEHRGRNADPGCSVLTDRTVGPTRRVDRRGGRTWCCTAGAGHRRSSPYHDSIGDMCSPWLH